MTTVDNDPEPHESQLSDATLKHESLNIEDTVAYPHKQCIHATHDSGEHSTDDPLLDVIHDSDDSMPVEPADAVTAHYDNLSESLQSSPIDDDEEDKMEQEIATRLSHLRIDRNRPYPSSLSPAQAHVLNSRHFYPLFSSQSPKVRCLNRTNDLQLNDTDCYDIESMLTMDDMDDVDDNGEDDDDDDDEMAIHVDDAHYNSHCAAIMSTDDDDDDNAWFKHLHREFFSNETFLKYVMLYGTIYIVARFTLNRYSLNCRRGGSGVGAGAVMMDDTQGVSQRIILLSNAILTVSKTHRIWNANTAALSATSLFDYNGSSSYMETQKAFHLVMLVLSYFDGSGRGGHSERVRRHLMRLYNLVSIGCIMLIKKYKKFSGLYMYTQFWLQLSSLFGTTSKMLSSSSSSSSRTRRIASQSSLIIRALIMIYSRIYLFTKVMIPVIQKQYRDHEQYMHSAAAIAWLIRNYYQTGDRVYQTFLSKK
eukprot:CAMPEP_0202698238 /NCGR_PEP_ID=MMETSP1385-20130828/11511_1 /ASSEMBLY_ACC=CAM_ASM_000861 /TAXON_ID=933848 /ORGANISM="Elphidium margaritaceum" /LENGTH=477 /DNA_ID=CAMNT_0049354895 /DNA_START=25 /DNA_END=1458 /DNA_ORIENTATION=-